MREPKSEVWPVEKVIVWEDNPRTISKKDFARLKDQIKKHGLYKPIIVNQDGIVLGGNMRYQALVDLGIKQVWVSIIETNSDAEMFEIALSDNDRAGEYDKDKLAELATLYPLKDIELYKIDTGRQIKIDKLPNFQIPDQGDGDDNQPEDETLREIKFKLTSAQQDVVYKALRFIKEHKNFDAIGNEDKNGTALFFVCREFLDYTNGLKDDTGTGVDSRS